MKIPNLHLQTDSAQRGQMLVAVIVLLALLFFVGTAMALAVSSSLRTVAIAASTDATSYAAEAALAQGIASIASENSGDNLCQHGDPRLTPLVPLKNKANGQLLRMNAQALSTLTCYQVVAADAAIRRAAIPAHALRTGSALAAPLVVTVPGTAWGVIGWHSTGNAEQQLGVSVGASAADAHPCTTPVNTGGLLYFQCHVTAANNTLFLLSTGESPRETNTPENVNLTAFVVREADSPATGGDTRTGEGGEGTSQCLPAGSHDCIATTIGMAGPMADEADVRLPQGHWTNVTQVLWNRVLP